jgi:hypothetical protein
MIIESTKLIYVGMNDTDNHVSRGTGRLERALAEYLTGGSGVMAGVQLASRTSRIVSRNTDSEHQFGTREIMDTLKPSSFPQPP